MQAGLESLADTGTPRRHQPEHVCQSAGFNWTAWWHKQSVWLSRSNELIKTWGFVLWFSPIGNKTAIDNMHKNSPSHLQRSQNYSSPEELFWLAVPAQAADNCFPVQPSQRCRLCQIPAPASKRWRALFARVLAEIRIMFSLRNGEAKRLCVSQQARWNVPS